MDITYLTRSPVDGRPVLVRGNPAQFSLTDCNFDPRKSSAASWAGALPGDPGRGLAVALILSAGLWAAIAAVILWWAGWLRVGP